MLISNNFNNSVLNSWHTLKGCIQVMQEKEGKIYFQIKLENGQTRKIKEVVSDIPLNVISRKAQCFSFLYPRVIKLSDNTLKMYLNIKLRGGVLDPEEQQLAHQLQIGNANVNNNVISNTICAALVADTYQNVQVRRIPYNFGILLQRVETRKISLRVNATKSFLVFFQGIGAGLGMHTEDDFKKIKNGNALGLAILGSNDNVARQELEAAYAVGSKLDLYISMDLNYIHLSISNSAGEEIYNSISGLKKAAQRGCIIL